MDKMREGDAIPTVEMSITQGRIESYAEASGDFNPIHVDPDFAATSQFGHTIAHGMMVAATISEAMAVAFQKDWPESGRLKLRFKAPVFPGDVVTAFGRVKSIRERNGTYEFSCSVGVRKQNGETAISGEATVVVQPTG
jgi:3-hydroxybutyryl-CoA dehydratase